MNMKMFLGGTIALALTLAVVSASAEEVQMYGATFESSVSTTSGELNDWAYELSAGVTTYADTNGEPYGWFGGADDASTIIAANGGQALHVDTGSSILTNKLASGVTSEINPGLLDAGACLEMDLKLTTCNVLGAGIPDGADAPKLALYSYCDNSVTPCTTNLVIYHAYLDSGELVRTNEVFDTLIDAESYTRVRIVMKTIYEDETPRNVFSVAINGGEPLSSDAAYSEGIWFLSAEGLNAAGAEGISSVCFSGSGEVDNIGLGVVQSESPISYKDPEGRDIEDPVLVEWFLLNDFTQADINALGDDTAATDKLYECFLLNCSIKAQEPGGALSVIGFAVSNEVSVTVQLVRQYPLGFINGVIHIYGADDLASGFSLISEESVGFGAADDPVFDTDATECAVTQSVTAFFNKTDVTAKFFKAKIEFPIVDNGEGGDEGGEEGGEEE